MDETFGTRLRDRIRALGPLCVGVDPSRELLESWDRGDTVEGWSSSRAPCSKRCVGTAAAIKPQVAFFERFGSDGYRVLERLIVDARDADVLVVADAKRGDFLLTNEGYAEAWLAERSPLHVDAVTASPYLGFDALAPLFDARATRHGRGVFVLAATSNDEGRAVQGARTPRGRTGGRRRAAHASRELQSARRRTRVRWAPSSGPRATRPSSIWRNWAVRSWCRASAPRVASAENVARLFARCPADTVLVNVARSILDGRSGAGRAA